MEKFVEFIIHRVRLIISVEFLLTIGIVFLLHQIPMIVDWISPEVMLDFTQEPSEVLRQIRHYTNMEYLREVILILLTMVLVYGVGECVRRKMKLQSLFSDSNKRKGNTSSK